MVLGPVNRGCATAKSTGCCDRIVRLGGEVSSGLGRAATFMAQHHYQEQFRELLGVTAWPGTLNVTVSGVDHAAYLALRSLAGIDTLDLDEATQQAASEIDTSGVAPFRIRGFLREGRSGGGATAFAGAISSSEGCGNRIRCAILIPDLTRHVDVVEVIAHAFLRESLDLVDGLRVILDLD